MTYIVLFAIILIGCGFLYWWCNPSFDIIKSNNQMTGVLEKHLIVWFSHIKYRDRNYIRIKI